MIVDCFPFFNELELLELRLRTLDAVVDRFVLAEAITTHTGIPKPLYFAENHARFAAWKGRIVHLVDRAPPAAEAWVNERRQRDLLAQALADLAPDDVVLMSDCDEIPRPESLVARPGPGELLAFDQIVSQYFANLRSPGQWLGTRAFRTADFARWGRMHVIRGLTSGVRIIPQGGWHFTFLGDREKVRTKLLATPHVEFGIPYYRDPYRVDALVQAGRSITDSGDALQWSAIDATFPAPLREDPGRWRAFIADPPAGDADVAARTHAHGIFAYVEDAADAVAVLTDDPDEWAAIGSRRFTTRFAGAVRNADELPALLRGASRPCVVADGFERLRPRALLALLRETCPAGTIVALTRNARSFAALAEVAGGRPFPPGEAIGANEIDPLFPACGYRTLRRDRLPMAGFWIDPLTVPEHLGLQIGRIRIDGIAKAQLGDLTATAFITVARWGG